MLGGYWISRLARVLAGDAGMATPQHTPRGRGFDSSLIYYHHANDYWTRQEGGCTANTSDPERPTRHVPCVDLWQDDGPAQAANASAGATYEEYLFKEQALRVLDAHDPAQPLFLYYAAHIAHQPYEVPASYNSSFAFIPDPQRQLYHAMVACLDDVLKELVAGFQAKGLWDDTLMVMSTVRARPLWLFDPIVCSQGGAALGQWWADLCRREQPATSRRQVLGPRGGCPWRGIRLWGLCARRDAREEDRRPSAPVRLV